MNNPPTSRDIQRWYPQKWREIAGNSEMIQAWWNFIVHGGCNMLFTGPSRTGKTRTIALGVKSLLCSHKTQVLDPCGHCQSCRAVDEARHSHLGLFSAVAGSSYSYIPIDCQTVTHDYLLKLPETIELEQGRTVIYLDEVAALGRRGLDSVLLKPIDESPSIWIASGITVTRRTKKAGQRKSEGLSAPMRGRFAIKIGTALPGSDELAAWIRERCRDWEIDVEQEVKCIPLLVERSAHRVGHVVHVLADAAARGRTLSLDRVKGFNFDAVD
ncbi:MAG: hypothetical protein ACUVQH_12310 [Thermogutta sp.]